jgi:hypothetical protein
MKMFVMSVVMALVCSSTLLAGGGSKANRTTGTVTVKNNTGATAIVSVGGTQAAIDAALLDPTPANLTAAKAQVINAGATATFTKVPQGSVTVQGVTLDAEGDIALVLPATTTTVTAGGVKQLNLNAGSGGLILASNFDAREMTFATIAMAGLGLLGAAGLMIAKKG